MELECEKQSDQDNHIESTITIEYSGYTSMWIVINVALIVLIVSGNLLTILAVRICRRLRAHISNMFILSLAVSDMIVGLTLPYHLAFYIGFGIGKSHILCLLRFYIIIFACSISLWNLILIAMDRYIAIVYPLHYRRYITRRVAMIIIAVGWMLGTLLACIPVFWNHWQTASVCEFYEILPTWYVIGIVTPSFVVVWVVLVLVYWRICREATKQVKQMRKASCTQERRFLSDWKSVQVVLLIMGGFTICWLPYFVVACGQIFASYTTSQDVYKGVLALAMANSGLNPIIYAWKNTHFRKSFSLLLRCKSPNCINNSEYSMREGCPRNACKSQDSASFNCIPVPPDNAIATVTNSNLQSEPPSQLVSTTQPVNDITTINELNAMQLLYHTEVTSQLVANESYVQSGVSCSSCLFCKMILKERAELSGDLKGSLVQWGCAEYDKYVLNAIKCRG